MSFREAGHASQAEESRPLHHSAAATLDERGSAYRAHPVASSEEGARLLEHGVAAGVPTSSAAWVGASLGFSRESFEPSQAPKNTQQAQRNTRKRGKKRKKHPKGSRAKKNTKKHSTPTLLGGKKHRLTEADSDPQFLDGQKKSAKNGLKPLKIYKAPRLKKPAESRLSRKLQCFLPLLPSASASAWVGGPLGPPGWPRTEPPPPEIYRAPARTEAGSTSRRESHRTRC